MRSSTLQTIADLAGISRAAVSLAMRDSPKISVRTRIKIKQIADEIGYRPNPLISALMTNLRAARPLAEQGSIAFITNLKTRYDWHNVPTYVRFFNGARERANRNGYQLEDFWLKEPRMTNRRMSHILYSRGICGAIIAPLDGKGGHLSLDLSELATVTFGVSMKRPQLHRADANQFESVRTAIRELKKRRYRRIGFAVHKDTDRHVNHHFSMAYMEYMYRTQGSIIPIYDSVKPTSGTFLAWVREQRLDGVISVTPAFLGWLERHYEIPEEVGYAVLDRSDLDAGVAGIDGRPELTGHAAVDMLIGQMHRNERGIPSAPRTLLINGIWIDGDTVRKVNSPKRMTAPDLET